jgi:hypothetical protein
MFLTLLALMPVAAPATHSVASVAYTPDGKLLFVGLRCDRGQENEPDFGRVFVWDLSKPELRAVVTGVRSDLTAVRPTPDGKRFLVVAGDELALRHSHAVDPHAVGAAEVADDEVVVHLRDDAVPARHLLGVQLDVALLVPAEQHDRLVDEDARSVGQREQVSGHGAGDW